LGSAQYLTKSPIFICSTHNVKVIASNQSIFSVQPHIISIIMADEKNLQGGRYNIRWGKTRHLESYEIAYCR